VQNHFLHWQKRLQFFRKKGNLDRSLQEALSQFKKSENMKKIVFAVATTLFVFGAVLLHAAPVERTLNDGNSNLNESGSWSWGSVLDGGGFPVDDNGRNIFDPNNEIIAVWNATGTGDNRKYITGTEPVYLYGFRRTGVDAMKRLSSMSVPLHIGAGGLTLDANTGALVLENGINLYLTGSQTWTINTGATLLQQSMTIDSAPNTTLTFAGGGTIELGTPYYGSGTTTINFGDGLKVYNPGNTTTKALTVANSINFTGKSNTLINNHDLMQFKFAAPILRFGCAENGTPKGTYTYKFDIVDTATMLTYCRFEGSTSIIGDIVRFEVAKAGTTASIELNTPNMAVNELYIGQGINLMYANANVLNSGVILNVDGFTAMRHWDRNNLSQTVGGLKGTGLVEGGGSTTAAQTLTINGEKYGTKKYTFSGTLADSALGGREFNIVKDGGTTQVFDEDSVGTYTGTTQVKGGTLIINGNFSGATGEVTVGTSGTLGGSGQIGGKTTVSGALNGDGATFAGDLVFASGATWNLTSHEGTIVNGLLSTQGPITLNFATSAGTFVWTGADDANSATFFICNGVGFDINNVDQYMSFTGAPEDPNNSGYTIVDSIKSTDGVHFFFRGWEFVPIPEPSTWLLLGAGAAFVAIFRRRQAS